MSPWKQKIIVNFEGLDTFEERRDAMVAKLQASHWVRNSDQGLSNLAELVEELAETGDGNYYDLVMGQIYDEADADRVWIEVRRG